MNVAIAKLVGWTHAPTTADELKALLRLLDESDLTTIMQNFRGQAAGTIAWAELGARYGYYEYTIGMARMNGRLELSFDGDSIPITQKPVIRYEPA
jgi:hypothetical protein